MRCLTVGCNPVLYGQDQADEHVTANPGHRTADWPVRSTEGRRRAKARNRTGYYDRYNTGAKSAEARGLRGGYRRTGGPAADEGWDDHKGAW